MYYHPQSVCVILLKHRQCSDTTELFVVQNVKFLHTGKKIQQGVKTDEVCGQDVSGGRQMEGRSQISC